MISPRPMSNGDIRTRTRAPGPIALSPTTSRPPGMNATIRCPLGRDAFQALVSKAHRISASNAIVSSAFICAGADFTPFFGKVKPFERKKCEMFAITRNEGGEGGGRRGGRGAGHGRGEGGRLGGIVQLWAGEGGGGRGREVTEFLPAPAGRLPRERSHRPSCLQSSCRRLREVVGAPDQTSNQKSCNPLL